VPENLVRLSVGIEGVDDLLADVLGGLDRVTAAETHAYPVHSQTIGLVE